MSNHPYQAYLTEAGTVDRAKVMKLAHAKARHEQGICRKVGFDRPYCELIAEALRIVWGRAIVARNNARDYWNAAPKAAPVVSRADALRRELELLPYVDSYRAAEARKAEIVAELAGMAA